MIKEIKIKIPLEENPDICKWVIWHHYNIGKENIASEYSIMSQDGNTTSHRCRIMRKVIRKEVTAGGRLGFLLDSDLDEWVLQVLSPKSFLSKIL